MRITTGRFKGRVIRTVNDLSVRPATDRVRQTIFNILAHRMDLEEIMVLDLFAGSGSLGFEALSRGAARATFVENDPRVVAALEHTAQQFGCAEAADIVRGDALRYLRRARGGYHLIFADPPYAYPSTADLPGEVFSHGLVREKGYLIIEHAATLRFAETERYALGPVKAFGRTVVTFFTAKEIEHETTPGGLPGNV
jgi:16S rRNA (guanine966-N2)-methyltransferase